MSSDKAAYIGYTVGDALSDGTFKELEYNYPENPLFPLGLKVVTPGVRKLLTNKEIKPLLERHVTGDWGKLGTCQKVELTPAEREAGYSKALVLTSDVAKLNKLCTLGGGGRVMSEYIVKQKEVWILTDIAGDSVKTTILLPSEY